MDHLPIHGGNAAACMYVLQATANPRLMCMVPGVCDTCLTTWPTVSAVSSEIFPLLCAPEQWWRKGSNWRPRVQERNNIASPPIYSYSLNVSICDFPPQILSLLYLSTAPSKPSTGLFRHGASTSISYVPGILLILLLRTDTWAECCLLVLVHTTAFISTTVAYLDFQVGSLR